MGRRLRTHWDLLKPYLHAAVLEKQSKQKMNHDRSRAMKSFKIGQDVRAKNFRTATAWIPGIIIQQLGLVTYLGDVSDGRMWKLVDKHGVPLASQDSTGL